jgi:hypothetical protein
MVILNKLTSALVLGIIGLLMVLMGLGVVVTLTDLFHHTP